MVWHTAQEVHVPVFQRQTRQYVERGLQYIADSTAPVLTVILYGVAQGDAYDAFIGVAQKSEDAVFVQTTKKDVAKAAGLSSAGVAVITNFEGGFSPASGA